MLDFFVASLESVPGIPAVKSYSNQLRIFSQGHNEGSPKMSGIPIDPANTATLATEIAWTQGYVNTDCSMTAVHVCLEDHRATC